MDNQRMHRRNMLKVAGLGAAAWAADSTTPNALGAESKSRTGGKSEQRRDTEILVCGGGPSGMAAAVMAARLGRKVLLIERYGRLGGMAVQAMVGPLAGSAKSPFVEEVLKYIGGRDVDYERIDQDYARLVQKAGADFLLHAWAAEPLVQKGRVSGVKLLTKQGVIRVSAAVTVDATGDGDVAWMAGAPFEQGRPSDGLLQPMSIMYRIGGVAAKWEKPIYFGTEKHLEKIPEQARTPQMKIIAEAIARGELPSNLTMIRIYKARRENERVINATQINHVDGTKIEDLTHAEMEGRRQAWQVLEVLKQHLPGFENAYISGMPAIVGVRETRRFLGVAYLVRADLEGGRKWPTAVVKDANFPIDIHNPTGGGQAEDVEGAPQVKPYDIPYGCLVPRETDGLLLAGRCISGSHEAHSSYRVQCIAMAIGAAAGAAAATAVEQKIEPRAVEAQRVQKILGLIT